MSTYYIEVADGQVRYTRGSDPATAVPSSADELMAELDSRKAPNTFLLSVLSAVGCIVAGFWQPWFFALAPVLAGAFWKLPDLLRPWRPKLQYRLDPAASAAYFQVYNLFATLKAAHGVWVVHNKDHDIRYREYVVLGEMEAFACNLPVVLLASIAHSIIFLPDQIWVQAGGKLERFPYSALRVAVDSGQYQVVEGEAPVDTRVIARELVEHGLLSLSMPGVAIELAVSNPSLLHGARAAFTQPPDLAGFEQGKVKLVGVWTDLADQDLTRLLYRYCTVRLEGDDLVVEDDRGETSRVTEISDLTAGTGFGPDPRLPLIREGHTLAGVTLAWEDARIVCYFEGRPEAVERLLADLQQSSAA